MATSYLAPGVYVEEISTGPRPIEAVGTSTAAFIGEAPNNAAYASAAEAVNNWDEFRRKFVGDATSSTMLAHAVYGFFRNGGRRCYVVNIGKQPIQVGLSLLERIDDISIVAAPGYVDVSSYEAILSHCEAKRNCFAILDSVRDTSNIALLTQAAIASAGGKPPKDHDGKEASDAGPGDAGQGPPDSNYGAFYFPWILVKDPLDLKSGELVAVPPSGHLAGIYARTDTQRGVHKAPANERINGAVGLTYRVTHSEQELLNPAGVNCIRYFVGEGIRVWGGRTVAKSSSEWRYINVRRLFNMIEESISRSTRWVVFEPNDPSLWKKIRRDITAFLTPLWRQGALFGATPEEAFFVKCDAETNPPEEVDNGRVVVLIGIAPVKPAEFVIFRIGQGAGGTEVETQQ